jgi:hypothetical protein
MVHPNSLANLKPPWKKGEGGRHGGRPAAGMVVREWWNEMADWTSQQLEAVANDATESVAKRAAARRWLAASSELARKDELEMIVEQTGGKAKQQLEVSGGIDHKLHAVMGAALNDPESLKSAKQMAARAKALTNDSGTGTN